MVKPDVPGNYMAELMQTARGRSGYVLAQYVWTGRILATNIVGLATWLLGGLSPGGIRVCEYTMCLYAGANRACGIDIRLNTDTRKPEAIARCGRDLQFLSLFTFFLAFVRTTHRGINNWLALPS